MNERRNRSGAGASACQPLSRAARRGKRSGVTLIEMLVVVTIIALFAALVIPKFFGKVDVARRTAAHAQINAFMTALGAYKLDTGTFPPTEQGLQALRVKPENTPQWAGPYLPQDVPPDPWGHPYQYSAGDNNSYEIWTTDSGGKKVSNLANQQ